MAFEYYEFVDVDRYASIDDINRACKKKRRALTIDNDTAGLQHLNQVQQTLLDELARKSYDEMQEFGDEITENLEQASEKMEAEAWPEATRLLKRLLVLAPQQVAARNLLGICFTRLEDYEEASRIYSKLLVDHPETPLYWANAGYVYFDQAKKYPLKLTDGTLQSECPHCEKYNSPRWRGDAFQYRCDHCGKLYDIPAGTKEVWYSRAREHYQKAVELEPYNPEHYMQIAETYTGECRYPKAIDWTEKAINADGQPDFDDFDCLFYLCRVYSLMGEQKKMEETAMRIAALVPPDIEEAREYAVYHFGNFAYELSKLHIFKAAASFAKCAIVINPGHQAASDLFEFCEAVSLADEEFERLKTDHQIIEPMKRLAAFSLTDAYEHDIEDREGVLEDIFEQFWLFPKEQFIASLKRLKQRYQGSYRLDRKFYDDCEIEISGTATPVPPTTGQRKNTAIAQNSNVNESSVTPSQRNANISNARSTDSSSGCLDGCTTKFISLLSWNIGFSILGLLINLFLFGGSFAGGVIMAIVGAITGIVLCFKYRMK